MAQPSLRVIAGTSLLKERLSELYAARRRGDADTFAAAFAEDGVFRIQADSRLVPEAGPYRGRPAIMRGFRDLVKRYEFVDALMVEIIADVDVAVVRRHLTLRSTTTGAIGDFDIADFVQFRSGEIIELDQYMDTASLAVLAGRI
ncbi:nuclear transport factor 2 family protein [Phreatobacter oligotrophus]|jgi:ketosteroid isomerase-like protein|uniref:Ketosteroid isomerase-like protein n=1 Tax=Phreatobacter oligotrophus TaxID=1122261 RepID=A0A2T4ZGC5_9HYPH|nr:nuclear transport factor 2 family protein [Phreatobacter oligotrophus]PTM60943.1 ketosteroid isomerase-like protein [Phreatobacter oligotrophus]